MTDEPSLPEKAKNFTRTAFDIAKGFVSDGILLAPDELQKARLDICRDCNRFDPIQILCKECGCPLLNKVKFSKSRCPLTPHLW
tara:strand:- start:231 stop:482 length:252 start_codon:yes stop_codon:yes gene_type:complete